MLFLSSYHFSTQFQVQLEFSEKQGLPGSDVNLHVEAAANSYCALRAVDQSVLLLNPERELSPETVSLASKPYTPFTQKYLVYHVISLTWQGCAYRQF